MGRSECQMEGPGAELARSEEEPEDQERGREGLESEHGLLQVGLVVGLEAELAVGQVAEPEVELAVGAGVGLEAELEAELEVGLGFGLGHSEPCL